MINKERILQGAKRVVRQHNLPLKIQRVEEGTEAAIIYFTSPKHPRLKELTRELEFQLNLPVKLQPIKESEAAKIGSVGILGKLPCCATFLRRCPFGRTHGCGYGFSVASTAKEQVTEIPPTAKKFKKKKKKIVRRLVIR